MVRVAVVGIALVGCYSPYVTPGVACVTDCPGDQQCIDGFCRDPGYVGEDADIPDAMIDGSPLVDTDGDTLFDDVDNCVAVANPDQHDEDRDDLGDVCDPCPHVAVGGAADMDADGVGDACDPAPTVAKQRWVYFDPFTSRRSEWSQSNATTFVNDQMRLTGYVRLTVPLTDARIMTGGSVAVATGSQHQGAIQFGDIDGDLLYYAEFYDENSGGGVKMSKYNGTTYASVFSTGYPNVIPAAPFTWTVDFSATQQTVSFAATHGALTFPTKSGSTSSPALAPSPYLFFGAINVTITYDYVALIATE